MSLLRVEGLTVALPPGGDRPHAVEDVSFQVDAGEILCVVGESGSGKSISADAVIGLLPKGLRYGPAPSDSRAATCCRWRRNRCDG